MFDFYPYTDSKGFFNFCGKDSIGPLLKFFLKRQNKVSDKEKFFRRTLKKWFPLGEWWLIKRNSSQEWIGTLTGIYQTGSEIFISGTGIAGNKVTFYISPDECLFMKHLPNKPITYEDLRKLFLLEPDPVMEVAIIWEEYYKNPELIESDIKDNDAKMLVKHFITGGMKTGKGIHGIVINKIQIIVRSSVEEIRKNYIIINERNKV